MNSVELPSSPRSTLPVSQTASTPGEVEFLERMAHGDRAAAAAFVITFGPLIRRRIRGMLRASMRSLYDSEDILSTVGRRLDAYVMAQRFQGQSIGEFWSLINKIARNSIVEKARIVASLRAVESEDGPVAHRLLERIRDADSESSGHAELLIDRLLDLLPDPVDRDIATLWMLGVPHAEIAARLEMSEINVRKKWQRIREHLRAEIEEWRS